VGPARRGGGRQPTRRSGADACTWVVVHEEVGPVDVEVGAGPCGGRESSRRTRTWGDDEVSAGGRRRGPGPREGGHPSTRGSRPTHVLVGGRRRRRARRSTCRCRPDDAQADAVHLSVEVRPRRRRARSTCTRCLVDVEAGSGGVCAGIGARACAAEATSTRRAVDVREVGRARERAEETSSTMAPTVRRRSTAAITTARCGERCRWMSCVPCRAGRCARRVG
jgi:hypothetical protein